MTLDRLSKVCEGLPAGTEILIYGLAPGETERYTEELLSTNCRTPAHIQAVIDAAGADGWHSFRVTTFTPGDLPDFRRALNL